MRESILYEKLSDKKVKCNICRHRCVIAPGERGYCQTRLNKNGALYSLIYNRVSSMHADPIE
ncbi:MAG: AmmeMemoRadiSam system radical SAM enzyme, partial [Candidatus Omnitrophota bacterium]